MENIFARIGEHTFKIKSESEHLLKYINGLYQINENENIDMLIMLKSGYGVPFVNFDVDITKDNCSITYRRADYLIVVDSDFKIATVEVYDDFALKHALMNLYSSFIVYHNWGLLVHSSCVTENGKAHIFSGQSGAGKSTAAKLSAPREILSDEATIIKIASGEMTVFNSPFRSEIEPTTNGEPMPLESIQLLNQALEIRKVKVKKSDALIKLMDKVFYWAHSPEEMTRIFGLLKRLVENISVYQLYFEKNDRFWELIS